MCRGVFKPESEDLAHKARQVYRGIAVPALQTQGAFVLLAIWDCAFTFSELFPDGSCGVKQALSYWGKNMQKTIFVVDDNLTNLAIVEEALGNHYQTMTLSSAADMFELLEKVTPDLILLDIEMPDMDGLETIKVLQANDKYAEIPVIFLTGRTDSDAEAHGIELGAVDFITKPFSKPVLLNRIRNHLHIAELIRARTAQLRELKAAELRHKRLLENVPLVIFVLNEQLELTQVSKAAYQVLGSLPEDIVASPDWFMNSIHPDDHANVRALLKEAFTSPGSEPLLCEFRFLRAKNPPTPIFLQLRGSISEWASVGAELPARHMEGALLDLSERVFLEQVVVQREKLNTMVALIDEVAHEFRNPIFALAGFTRILKRKYPDAQETEVILEEASRLETMINRVQEYLVPVEVSWAPCNLANVVRFVADMLHTSLTQRGIGLELNIEEIPPVESDIDILTQIIVGMFSMAVNWAEPDSTVHVHCRSSAKGQEFSVAMIAPNIMDSEPDLRLIPLADGGKSQPLVLGHKLARALGCLLSLRHEKDKFITTLFIPRAAKNSQLHKH